MTSFVYILVYMETCGHMIPSSEIGAGNVEIEHRKHFNVIVMEVNECHYRFNFSEVFAKTKYPGFTESQN